MRWFWQKRQDPPLEIPPYHPPIVQEHKPKESGIEVQEVDTSQMTMTGVHKAWRKLTGHDG